jgi:carbon monoxide dehydrogenase subunit G
LNVASILKYFTVAAPIDEVWDALRDFGALHTRLAPGFVVDCRLDGKARDVSFANGGSARELLVDCDDARRRLAYAIAPNERIAHYSAATQLTEDGHGQCRVEWTVDLLPDGLAPYVAAQMDLGIAAMKKTLDRAAS